MQVNLLWVLIPTSQVSLNGSKCLQCQQEKLLSTRIAFMGNSITEHWANDSATTLFHEGRWINAGISGHTTRYGSTTRT